jgi:hypothetical protein
VWHCPLEACNKKQVKDLLNRIKARRQMKLLGRIAPLAYGFPERSEYKEEVYIR